MTKYDRYPEVVIEEYRKSWSGYEEIRQQLIERLQSERLLSAAGMYWDKIDLFLDTHQKNQPKMITGVDYRYGLSQVVQRPFRLVPYFDVSIWGGTWMEEKFQLEQVGKNCGWAFDGVPEENSLYLRYGDVRIEIPTINVVFQHPDELLGARVHSRFGKEFPIRFDYLDTMNGGKLNLQVHPLTEYKFHKEERIGLHELEFIETRRHWFEKEILLSTYDSVNRLNLVEGEEAIVESLDGGFRPFKVHYGETFIIPEQIEKYHIILIREKVVKKFFKKIEIFC